MGAVCVGLLTTLVSRAPSGRRALAAPSIGPAESAFAGQPLFGAPTKVHEGRSPAIPLQAAKRSAISLEVVDSSARPISACRATLIEVQAEGSAERRTTQATSDEKGRLRFLDLTPGEALQLTLGGEGWARQQLSLALLLPGEERELGQVVLSPERSILGLITGPDGLPVEGARITAAKPLSSFDRLKGRVPLEEHASLSDETGHFVLGGVPEGTFGLEASSPGLSSVRIEPFRVPEDLAGEPLRIRLGLGAVVKGSVVDENGDPLPEARVVHVRSAYDLDEGGAREVLKRDGIEVDGSGDFSLGGLPPNRRAVVVASAPGHVLAVRTVEGTLDGLRLVLPRACALEGHVLDDDGNGIGGADLVVNPVDLALLAGRIVDQGAESGPDGAFRFGALPPGEYRVVVSCAAGQVELGPIWVTESTPPLVARVHGSSPVTVQIVDGTLVPMSEVLVHLEAQESEPASPFGSDRDSPADRRLAWTDERGEAHFFDLPAGIWNATVSRRGTKLLEQAVEIGETLERIQIVVESPGSIVLDVVDREGLAIPRASVQLFRRTESGTLPVEAQRRVDDYGRTAWVGLAPGAYEVDYAPPSMVGLFGMQGDELRADGSSTRVEVLPDRASPLRLVLSECVVRVRVTRGGLPVSGALVGVASTEVVDDEAQPGEVPSERDLLAGLLLGADLCVSTDGHGWATMVVPEPRGYVLQARSTPQSPLTSQLIEVRSASETVSFELAGGSVLGVISGAYGPLEGVQVRLVPEPSLGKLSMGVRAGSGHEWKFPDTVLSAELGESSSFTDPDGKYRFFEVSEGDYRIHVDHPGYALHASPPFLVPDPSVGNLGETRLDPACILRGTIRHGMERDPDSGFLGAVKLVSADGRVLETHGLDESGTYEFTQTATGRYRLVVQVRDKTREGEEFEILPERLNVQDLEVPQ